MGIGQAQLHLGCSTGGLSWDSSQRGRLRSLLTPVSTCGPGGSQHLEQAVVSHSSVSASGLRAATVQAPRETRKSGPAFPHLACPPPLSPPGLRREARCPKLGRTVREYMDMLSEHHKYLLKGQLRKNGLGRARRAGCGVVQEVHAVVCGGPGGVRSGPSGQRRPHILSPTLWPACPIIPSPWEPPLSSVRSSPLGSPGNQPPFPPNLFPPNLTAPLGPPGLPLPLWSPGSGAQ